MNKDIKEIIAKIQTFNSMKCPGGMVGPSGEMTDDIALMFKHLSSQRCLIRVNNKCPMNCYFCNDKAKSDGTDIVNLKYADKYMSFFEPDSLFVAHGGEALETPKITEKLFNLAKKHKLATCIITSGYWLTDSDITNFVVNELKPTYISFSVDSFKQNTIDLQDIRHFIDLNPQMKYVITVIVQNPWDFETYDNVFGDQIRVFLPVHTPDENRTEVLDELIKFNKNCCYCMEPDGSIGIDCSYGINSCRLGHVKKLNSLNELSQPKCATESCPLRT